MKRRILSSVQPKGMNKKPVEAADQSKGQEAFDEAMDNLQDDFDYLLDGLEKMVRDGGDGQSQALQIVLEASQAVNSIIDKVANNVAQ